ncbi:hypothetical protein [Clostridium sp. ZS1]|uniref:hypothetical protein n=1 Tax=Clostridium sp. ZS1 TaxID=2949989 RepID=UPI002079D39F|nr:hypothetical protein [Clostridium sp. ZS1]
MQNKTSTLNLAPILVANKLILFIGAKILILYVLWLCIIISITPLLCIYKKI